MRIAVTYANGEIFQHFGRTEQFKVYDVENGQVLRSQVVDTGGQGHGALAGVLQQLGADVLICGGIGGGAQAALASAGIRLYGGASGPADAAVDALLAGRLDYQPDVHCDHHGEHHDGGHHCGSHGCAGNGGCWPPSPACGERARLETQKNAPRTFAFRERFCMAIGFTGTRSPCSRT